LALLCSCTGDSPEGPGGGSSSDTLTLTVLDTLPHSTDAYTQGLEISGGILWESTGLYGQSSIRRLDPQTGELISSTPLPDTLFGEGITFCGPDLLQLTWLSGAVLRWDTTTMQPTVIASIDTEGWGMCLIPDSASAATTDGTCMMRFRDPLTFEVRREVSVTYNDKPVVNLNELEYAGGRVWANQYGTSRIYRIDPATGHVDGLVDCAGVLEPGSPGADVMNGIAWDESRGAFLVTGKLWARMYVIDLR
jgi:glutamine cyclotransferase